MVCKYVFVAILDQKANRIPAFTDALFQPFSHFCIDLSIAVECSWNNERNELLPFRRLLMFFYINPGIITPMRSKNNDIRGGLCRFTDKTFSQRFYKPFHIFSRMIQTIVGICICSPEIVVFSSNTDFCFGILALLEPIQLIIEIIVDIDTIFDQ